jgi:hypothetical protein
MAKKEIKKVEKEQKFVSLIQDTQIIKTNCKLCQSKFRAEAEEKFEQSNNIRAVRRFLLDNGEEICYQSVRNHLLKHYLGSQRLESVKEWLEDVDRYSCSKYDRRINLYGRVKALNREFALIAAGTDGMPLDDRRRSADILKKLSDGVSGLEDKIDEIDNELAPVEIIIENLQGLLADKIKSTPNEEVKRAFMDLLNELSDTMGDMLVEK